jgi:hypothetical protein
VTALRAATALLPRCARGGFAAGGLRPLSSLRSSIPVDDQSVGADAPVLGDDTSRWFG